MRHAAFRTVSGQRMQNSKTDPCALSLARLALDTLTLVATMSQRHRRRMAAASRQQRLKVLGPKSGQPTVPSRSKPLRSIRSLQLYRGL